MFTLRPHIKRNCIKQLRYWSAGLMMSVTGIVLALPEGEISATDPLSVTRFASPLSIYLESLLIVPEPRLQIAKTTLHYSRETLRTLYSRVGYAPVWTHPQGLNPRGKLLFDALQNAAQDGLNPALYHVKALAPLLPQDDANGRLPIEQRAALELLLSDAYLRYSTHLFFGVTQPRRLDKRWEIKRDESWEPIDALQLSLEEGAVRRLLEELPPPDPNYLRLRASLQQYLARAARGERWPKLPAGESFEQGQTDPRVLILREQLRLQGDYQEPATPATLPVAPAPAPVEAGQPVATPVSFESSSTALPAVALPKPPPAEYFDAALHEAVMRFQHRHALYEDGVIGEKTRQALNVSLQQRILQLQINLERWRWFPRHPGERYIRVNVPGFFLHAFSPDQPPLQMKVIVGTEARETPLFNGEISYMILNPRWLVPRSIAVKDLLPKIRQNPDFLEQSQMQVYSTEGRISSGQINWEQLHSGNFPYRLVQDPGRGNALGKVKFMFPNHHGVYLHDTNKPYLFKKAQRTLSSGCVRVEDPMELAGFLLSGTNGWDKKRVLEVTLSGKRTQVNLSENVPVYLAYWTAWVDENGQTQFYDDVYGYDQGLAKALEAYLPELPKPTTSDLVPLRQAAMQ